MPELTPTQLAGATALLGLAAGLIKVYWDLAQMHLKVETLWKFLWSRGESELLEKKMATKNSPVRINPEVIERANMALAEIAPDLRRIYRKMSRRRPPSDIDLAFQIELQHGAEIKEKICDAFGVNQGACLHLALAVAKDVH